MRLALSILVAAALVAAGMAGYRAGVRAGAERASFAEAWCSAMTDQARRDCAGGVQ